MHHDGIETLLFPFVNFIILVGFLTFMLRKPIRAFVSGRHETIRQTVMDTRERLLKSQSQYEDFSAKLKAVANEEQAIREQATREGRQISDRLVKHAQERAVTIVNDAKVASETAASDLKMALRAMFVSKVVGRTEELLKEKLTSADSERLRKEFSSQVGDSK